VRQIRSLLYVLCITSMIFIVSLIITQRVYGITVTNPTPNPFNPNLGQTTSISFSVDNTQYVTVKIVNCRSSYVYLPLDDLIHTTWSYSYMNVWGSPDAVTYGQEIIKTICEDLRLCWANYIQFHGMEKQTEGKLTQDLYPMIVKEVLTTL